MVRSSRSKAVGKTGSKSNSTATSARKPRATQAQVHESDDDDALEHSQVLKKQTKSAPKPKASAKKPASRPKTINSNAVSSNLSVEYAKSGKSSCGSKGCTDPTIQKGSVRVAVSKKWHHVGCLGPDQIKSCSAQSVAGFDNLNEGDQAELEEIFDILNERRSIVATPPPSEDDQVLQAKKVAPAKKTKKVEAKAPKVAERARGTRQVR